MKVPLIDLTEQYEGIAHEILPALRAVVESQRFVLGPEVEGLENELAAYLGVGCTVGVASGTDALLLPLKALDAEPEAPKARIFST